MNFRKGDIVTIKGTVKYDTLAGETVTITPEGHYSDVHVPASTVTLLQPKFEVGDAVIWGTFSGDIVAIYEECAWIKAGANGALCTVALVQLTRLPSLEETLNA